MYLSFSKCNVTSLKLKRILDFRSKSIIDKIFTDRAAPTERPFRDFFHVGLKTAVAEFQYGRSSCSVFMLRSCVCNIIDREYFCVSFFSAITFCSLTSCNVVNDCFYHRPRRDWCY